MDVFEAIHTRTSVSTMTDKEPPREEIERMLDAAIQAPNHRLTEPWRFRVLRGDARNILGGALAEVAASAGLDSVAQEKARAKPLRSPVVIIVTAKDGKDEVETFENRYAVAAAVQNMLLAAHALGLATIWRSGGSHLLRSRAESPGPGG